MEAAKNKIRSFCKSNKEDDNIKLIVIVILAHGEEVQEGEEQWVT